MRALIESIRERRRQKRMARRNSIVHDEGHLGGFISSSQTPTLSGLDVSNGDPATWTPELWDWAASTLEVRSVLDVGCGEGHAASYFRSLGCDVAGVDGSPTAKRQSQIPDVHMQHDFQQGPFLPDRSFDLVWSCEFVEHVHEEFSPHFLQTFGLAQRYLMMTYAPPGQPGWHHVNCQPAEYWVDRIEQLGFQFDQPLTKTAREHCASGHFKTKGLVYKRAD